MKHCTRCDETKPKEQFPGDKSRKDGRYPTCKACISVYNASTKHRRAAQKAARYKANPAPAKARVAAYRAANPDVIKARKVAEWAALPDDVKRAKAEALREWKRLNKPKVQANTRRRQAAKNNAVPLWASPAKIQEFYDTASGLSMLTGEWYHVDHIVPLRGRTVCGLHTEHNLQVLAAVDNLKKNNRTWPDQP